MSEILNSPLFGESRRRVRITATTLLMVMAVILVADATTASGFAHGVLYVAVVLFSMMAGSRRPVVAEPEQATNPGGGSETILLVEDDKWARLFARDQLTELEYRVLEADSRPAALSILDNEDHIDRLFTDVVMPGGMSGRDLSDAAAKLRPGLRVLYTSGYAEDSIVHQGWLDPNVALLPKPNQRGALARRIRAALSETASVPQPHGTATDEQ